MTERDAASDAVSAPPADASSAPAHVKATREDWIKAGLATLVAEGVDQVKVLTLAKRLDVSRSSFYWYFKDRAELLDALVAAWRATNTGAIVARARAESPTLVAGVLRIFECWIDETLFDPRLDFALRDWGRRAPEVRAAVAEADEERLEAIAGLYRRHGFDAREAFVRARVLYFMQLGYFALELDEPMETRLTYCASYLRSFTGQDPDPDELAAFADIARRCARA